MTGPELIAALLADVPYERDRVLILFAICLPHYGVGDIVIMTVAKAEQTLMSLPEDTLGRLEALTSLKAWATRRGLTPKNLAFPSMRQWPHRNPVPLSRIQAWRVVRRAVTMVLSHSVDGSWQVVREAVGAIEGSTPVPVKRQLARENTLTLGQRAYEARLNGYAWATIAKTIGHVNAHGRARKYAAAHGLAWPPLIPEAGLERLAVEKVAYVAHTVRHDVRVVRGAKAYTMRLAGTDWPTIAKTIGYTCGTRAIEGARWHAKQSALPWPPKVRPGGPMARILASGEAAYEVRKTGQTWPEIAKTLNLPVWTVREHARKYAEQMGKPWPVAL